ncbi:MAG: hypothetical protein H0V40_13045 [Actinobacteria bacterium]|nr:hypothetical protein [Actinomycetota bacterium]
MPIAYLQEFDVDDDDRSTTNYDAVKERLNVHADPPDGLIVHTAGFDGGVFRIFDVWESEEHHKRFRAERLMPIVEQVMSEGGTGGAPAREYTYDLHDVVQG